MDEFDEICRRCTPVVYRFLLSLCKDASLADELTAETFSDLPRMIQETCVAEMIHVLLSLTGLGCLVIWPGIGGVLVTAVYILLGNLPFILIQRYNRPRLQRLLALQRRKQERKCQDAHTDTKLQYRRGA